MKTQKLFFALAAFAVCASAGAYDFNDNAVNSVTRTDPVSDIPAIKSSGWRPTSISVDSAFLGETRITGTWVQNAATHYKPYLFQWDLTEAQVDTIEANGWHIEDVEVYRKAGVKRFAVLAYSPSYQPNDTKWFQELTSTQLKSLYDSWSGRIADLDVMLVGGVNRYSGVLRKNTGAYRKGWYWHTAIAFNDIAPFLEDKGARVVDISQRTDGLYTVAYWTDSATYRYVSARSYDGIKSVADYYGYRIQNISQTTRSGDEYWTGVIVNTKNTQTRAIGDRLRSTSDGNVGAYLREVDGPTFVNLQQNALFYPASTMKIFMHVNAVWLTPTANLQTRTIPVWDNHTSNNHNGQTPTYTELPLVLQPMMVPSSNQMANACLDFWGMGNIEATMRSTFGMSNDTQLRSKLGLGGPNSLSSFTETTLSDFGLVYENAMKKITGTKRTFLRDNMISHASSTAFDAVAIQERNKLGVSVPNYNAWKARREWLAKAGGITGYTSIAGWMRLPFKNAAGITFRDYVFGLFKDDYTQNTESVWTSSPEMMRTQINQSLATYK